MTWSSHQDGTHPIMPLPTHASPTRSAYPRSLGYLLAGSSYSRRPVACNQAGRPSKRVGPKRNNEQRERDIERTREKRRRGPANLEGVGARRRGPVFKRTPTMHKEPFRER